jgi:hypothetical protein
VKAAPILLLVLAGCRAGTRDESSSDGTATKDQLLPQIVETTPITWSGAWGKGLRIRYETALDITNVPALRHEAESLWTTVREGAEHDGICTVELKASAPSRTLHVPGTAVEGFARRNYSFLLRHDSAGGAWRWLASLDAHTDPCPEH